MNNYTITKAKVLGLSFQMPCGDEISEKQVEEYAWHWHRFTCDKCRDEWLNDMIKEKNSE